jgi:sigma-B regulation protein RsbU (phosphoserine phosphatase)
MDERGKVRNVLTSTALPLGIEPAIRFGPGIELPIILQPGDLVLLYTDGVVEASTARAELFGEERLLRVVRDCRYEAPDQIVDRILRAVRDFCGKDVMDDDLAVIVVKATATADRRGCSAHEQYGSRI